MVTTPGESSGMDHVRVSFEIDTTTLVALKKTATDEGTQVGDILRGAVRRDLFRRSRAKKAVRPDERLVAPLRALLADDFAYATGWSDLQARLQLKGYALREAGGGLALVALAGNIRVAKASELGYSYQRLMRRFDAPFPGHSHRHLFPPRP